MRLLRPNCFRFAIAVIMISVIACIGWSSQTAFADETDDLESMIAQKQTELEDMRSDITRLDTELNDLQAQKEEASIQIADDLDRAYKLSRAVYTNRNIFTDLLSLLLNASSQNDFLYNLACYEKMMSFPAKLTEASASRFSDIDNRVAQITNEKTELEANISSAENELSSAQDQLGQARLQTSRSGREAMAWAACRYSYSRKVTYGQGYSGTDLFFRVCQETISSKMHRTPNEAWTILSCDRGVCAAVRWSGADTDFPPSASQMCQYLNPSGRWEMIGKWTGDTSILEPGDVVVRQDGYTGHSARHVCMYVGHDIADAAYEMFIKGTEGDLGPIADDAAWVSASYSHGNPSNASAACIVSIRQASVETGSFIFRCIDPQNSDRYSKLS